MGTVYYRTCLTQKGKERKALVIELYQPGKTIREIAKVVHMPFSRISQIINRFEGVNSD